MLEIPTKPYGKLDLISADDHIIEPGDVWTKRAPASLKDKAPHIISRDGVEMWQVEDKVTSNTGLSAMAGKKFEEYTAKAQNYKDMRLGCYDAKARVKDMDLDGVKTQVCFPYVPSLGGENFFELKDAQLRDWVITAYNDWLVEEFQAAAPGRLIGLGILPLYDVQKSVAELERIVKRGIKSISIPYYLEGVKGCKALIDPQYDPIWSSCEEKDIAINLHISSEKRGGWEFLKNPLPGVAEAYVTSAPLSNFQILADITWTGMLHRHPKLKVVSSEGGIGWVPYFLERADHTYNRHRFWTKSQLTQKPSEYFHRQCYVAFINDQAGIMCRNLIGVDNILWESDYPHTDTTWPYSHKSVDESLPNVPDAERRKIVYENAKRVYHLS